MAAFTADHYLSNQFYLTGGTALSAFYYQHRLSEDLDFFSETKYDGNKILAWVKNTAQKLKIKEVEYKKLHGQDTFFFNFKKDVVKIDFAFFPFEHLGKFKKIKTLKLSSVEDIAANKLQAMQARIRARDYFDLYTIMTKLPIQVQQLQKNYQLKFGIHLDNQEIAKLFYRVSESHDLPRFLGKVNWQKIEKFFFDQIKALKSKIFS